MTDLGADTRFILATAALGRLCFVAVRGTEQKHQASFIKEWREDPGSIVSISCQSPALPC